MDEFGIDWDVEDGSDTSPAFADVGAEPFAEYDVGPVDDEAETFEDFSAENEVPELSGEVVEGAYELLGADPDEEELWNQIMLDLNDDVGPYPDAYVAR